MKRYAIAMVAACPFPANHGSAASIREMSDTLTDMGHDVHIVTYPIGQENIKVRRAKVHRTGPFQPETNAKVGPSVDKLLYDVAIVRLLCRVIHEHKIDVIHAHNYEGALAGILAKWITRRPLLYNAVNLMSDELASYKFIRPAWLAKWFAERLDILVPKFPDRITAVSPELRNWMIAHGVPSKKVQVVPAGIEAELFDNADPERFRSRYPIEGRRVVMYTGVLNAFQRVDYLLRSFSVVAEHEPNAVLLVVSPLVSASHQCEYEALARKLGIDQRTIWIAPHELEELPSYLALAEVTVVPRPECPGHPVKLLNYMLAGKPSVCFAGGAKGVTHMKESLIVPDHDWRALGEGILTLLRDPELAARLGAAGRQTVLEKFQWRVICKDIESIYDALVKPARVSGAEAVPPPQ